jgi:hypothetical protein
MRVGQLVLIRVRVLVRPRSLMVEMVDRRSSRVRAARMVSRQACSEVRIGEGFMGG